MLGEQGHNKNHRPDLNPMVVGVIPDDYGQQVCCKMWPGNTTDGTTFVPVIKRLQGRIHIGQTIRGHVFCCFLALVLRKELHRHLERAGHVLEWSMIKQDLKALQEVAIEEKGRKLALRTECVGVCGKIFQAVGVALPATLREVA